MASAIARITHKLINPDEPISPHVNEIIENSMFIFFYNTKTVCCKHPEKIHTNSEIILQTEENGKANVILPWYSTYGTTVQLGGFK